MEENLQLKIENIKVNNKYVTPVRETATIPHVDQSGSKKSNVIPSGPSITSPRKLNNSITSPREYNNANIVTESILIDPEAKRKTKRASKKRRRKTITKKENENTRLIEKKRRNRSTVIVGDSLVKNIKDLEPKERCSSNENIHVRSFSGATTKDMNSYIQPTIDRSPNCILLHVGTNDLANKTKTEAQIAKEIVGLAQLIGNEGITVDVSGLVPRYDYLEPKRVRVNSVRQDLCSENNLSYTDHSNVNPSKHLNRSRIHVSKVGDNSFADNLFNATRALPLS